MSYYKIVGTQVQTANTQIDSSFKPFTKEILEDGTEMYSPQELQDALTSLKLEEDKAERIAEAKSYLASTDWIVTKIAELQLEGVDVEPLKTKYADELAERKLMREVV